MKKILTLLISGIMISLSASSQTIKDNIDKLAKDKATQDRAAKADVLIHKKSISDSTTEIKIIPVASSKTKPVKKVKYKKNKVKPKSSQ